MYSEQFKIETYIPETHVEPLRQALNAIGALNVGDRYDNCMAVSTVTGYWRPLAGANPYMGEPGQISREAEAKIEFACDRALVRQAVATIRQVHPYEEPVIHVLPLWDPEHAD